MNKQCSPEPPDFRSALEDLLYVCTTFAQPVSGSYGPYRQGIQQAKSLLEATSPKQPGPTYDVWIAEQEDLGPAPGGRALGGRLWESCGMTFTCDDDPDGKGARRLAHNYARYLRNTYPCAFVAVRRADRGMPFSVRYRDNQ
jgi:hypothetical protein